MKYAIWNNKGGVGKTFLTFVIACEYATQHSDKKIIMLDLCPQANLSEIALGGNGTGADKLTELIKEHKTIGGYFDARIKNPHTKTGTETDYLITNSNLNNPNLPKNIYLVAGDPSLEIQSQAINQISAQTLPIDSWSNVHKWLSDLIGAIQLKIDNSVFFIDCNPSFASYTELSILAAERLIIPCTADGSSARAIDNIGRLIYGIDLDSEYGEANFNKKAIKNKFSLPSIHIVTLNRSTQYDKRASKSFNAMFNEIKRRIMLLNKNNHIQFSSEKDNMFLDMPDAHSVSVVCSYEGVPLAKLQMGPHTIHDTKVQVNEEPYKRYKESLQKLVSHL